MRSSFMRSTRAAVPKAGAKTARMTRPGRGQDLERRSSSRSTASRMNCARFPGPTRASMRSSISGGSLTAVNLPIGGRPMRGALSVIFFCAKPCIFPLSPIDSNRYRL